MGDDKVTRAVAWDVYRRVGRREMMVFRLGLTASEAGQILGRRVGPEPLSYGWSEMRSLVSRTDLSYPARFQNVR